MTQWAAMVMRKVTNVSLSPRSLSRPVNGCGRLVGHTEVRAEQRVVQEG